MKGRAKDSLRGMATSSLVASSLRGMKGGREGSISIQSGDEIGISLVVPINMNMNFVIITRM